VQATAIPATPGTDEPVPYTLTPKAHIALGTFPPVVCLCGSTRFFDEFRRANLWLTLSGQIVLSIGCDTKSDGDLAATAELGHDPADIKARLDDLHKRKIDLADYVLVLNIGGYVGESTRSEITYARTAGKPVRYLEPVPLDEDTVTGEWSCEVCGAAYYGTPPDDARCGVCRSDS
jgi:hypothetical protein